MPSAGIISVILKGDMKGLEAALSRAQQRLDMTSRKMKNVGANMTAGLTVPLGLVAGASIKAASTFDSEMTKVETLVGVARDQVDGWRKDVLKLGPALGRGPTELARALFVVTSAGERGANALKIVENAGKAAASGLGDTADIARAVTSAMQAYGSENLSAERATDILLKTVREGNLEASDLASTLGRVIGVASAMGVEFEEVGGFIATFTRLGVQSAEAVTALRSFMSAMLKPSKDARKTLQDLGTSVEEVRDKIRNDGLADALLFLMDATRGNDDALAAIIPNVRALSGVLGTAKAQPEALKAIMASLKDETLALGPAFDRTRETTAQTMAEFKAQASALAISLGSQLTPAFSTLLKAATPVIELLARLVTAFSKLPGWVQTTVVALGGIAVVVGPLIYAGGAMVAAFGALLPVLTSLAGAATAAGAAVLAALGPGLLVALGIGALATGIGLIIKKIRDTRKEADRLKDSQKSLARTSVEQLEEHDRLSKALKGMSTAMKALIPQMRGENQASALKAWKLYEDQFKRLRAELIALHDQAGVELPIPDIPELPAEFHPQSTPVTPVETDDRSWDEIWRERVEQQTRAYDFLNRAGFEYLEKKKGFLEEELEALQAQGKGQSDLAMDLREDWLDTHQAIMDKETERLATEQALEERRRAFLMASGQLTKEARLAQIEEELAAVRAGTEEELALNEEKFSLIRQLTSEQIQDITRMAGASKEAVVQALQALLDKLGEIGEKFPEVGAMIEDAIDDASRSGVDSAGDMEQDMKRAGVQVGTSFVQGIMNGSSDMGPLLRDTMMRIAQQFIIKAFTVALGIASPSKVAMGWGRNLGMGLAMGIKDGVPQVKDAVGELEDAATLGPISLMGGDLFGGFLLPGVGGFQLPNLGAALPPVSSFSRSTAVPISQPLDVQTGTEGLRDYISTLRPSDPVLASRTPEFQRTVGETILELEANGWRITKAVRR